MCCWREDAAATGFSATASATATCIVAAAAAVGVGDDSGVGAVGNVSGGASGTDVGMCW